MYRLFVLLFCLSTAFAASPKPLRIALMGGPSSGKSSLARALEMQGQVVVHEAATDYIKLQQARGIPEPWKQPNYQPQIAKLYFIRANRAMTETQSQVVFFDRTEIDAFAYEPEGPRSDFFHKLKQKCQLPKNRYDMVFYLEPLTSYEINGARREKSVEASKAASQRTKDAYAQFGYKMIDVPNVSIDERVAFVMQTVQEFRKKICHCDTKVAVSAPSSVAKTAH